MRRLMVYDLFDVDAMKAAAVFELRLGGDDGFERYSNLDILPWRAGDLVVFLGPPGVMTLRHAVEHCRAVHVLARLDGPAFETEGLDGYYVAGTLLEATMVYTGTPL